MCEKCFIQESKNFPSHYDFENFEKILDLKCKNKIHEINTQPNKLEDFKIYYQCTHCNKKWIMSIPDNAWRGYFLTEKNAQKYLLSLVKENKNGCYVFFGNNVPNCFSDYTFKMNY